MKTMEMKIDEVHFMLSHLMKSKPWITGLEAKEFLGISSIGFMNLIIEDDQFPQAAKIDGKCSIFECEWWFESVSLWKKRNGDTLAQYKNSSGDVHERIKASYKKVTGKDFRGI